MLGRPLLIILYRDLLCPILEKVFGKDVNCISPEVCSLRGRRENTTNCYQESFTTLPTERFSHSAATQFYALLSSLAEFQNYLLHKLCFSNKACEARVSALSSASTLDISFDTISHALTLSAFYPSTTQPLSITKPKTASPSRLEVGILSNEKARETEELSLSGFLTVLGEDTKASPTLFSFPSRHHPTSQTFASKFLLPTGLHPTLELGISSSTPPLKDRSCTLHTHLTLPKHIFIDKYQFSDSLFLASKNLSALHYITSPVDLEAPAYTLPTWGSSALFELSHPSSSSKSSKWTAQIPLHLRYLPPNTSKSGKETAEVPYPIVFWACTADEGSKFPINPFDRVNLGYDGLFGPRTLFFHVNPKVEKGERLINTLEIPVLDLNKSAYVQSGTAIVVVLGFAWVLWCLVGVWRSSGYGSGSGKGNWSRQEEGKKDI